MSMPSSLRTRTLAGFVLGGLLVTLTACGPEQTPVKDGPPAARDGPACRPGGSGSTVSGHTFDQQGTPIGGVEIWIRIVPLNSGLGTFQTQTAADGSYSRDVPDGVYQVRAVTPALKNDQGEIQVGTDLTPLGNNAITVPPCAVVDFQLP